MKVLTLYHGTNKPNARAIRKNGYFKPWAWFGTNEQTARRYALMKSARVSSAVVLTCQVDADSLFQSGEYYTAKGKLILIDGVYTLEK
jgi:RNA:NAD 2'-phosphotransferase (TPT1/KptA family)